MKKNAIGYFDHKRSGCYWYRTLHVMDALELGGENTLKMHINTDIDADDYDSIGTMQLYGLYPFPMESVITSLKNDGKRIIYDMDDAVGHIDPTNLFYHSVKKDEGSFHEVVALADILTVSTPVMKEWIETHTDKKAIVVPNCYLESEWTFPRPKRDGFRIGFSGSATHISDLIDIIPVINNLQSKYDIRFMISGFGQSSYEEWKKQFRYIAQPEATTEMRKLDALLQDITFEWVPFVDFADFPSTLINMSLDIGICPLRDTPFNRHRSACKAMEYTLSGALALASDSPPYREDLNSVLVKEGDWEETLEKYIQNPDLLKETHLKHLQWTQENRNIKDKIDLLKSIYILYNVNI